MTIITKKTNEGIKEYILLGASRAPSSYGSPEEPLVVVCDKEGKIRCLVETEDQTVRVSSIDGRTPLDILGE